MIFQLHQRIFYLHVHRLTDLKHIESNIVNVTGDLGLEYHLSTMVKVTSYETIGRLEFSKPSHPQKNKTEDLNDVM